MTRAETRQPASRRATDSNQGCASLLDLLSGADEDRRLTTLAVVVDPLDERHKRMLARLLVDFLRRAAPSRRSPAVASLAALGPDAADAVSRGLCSPGRRAFRVDMMRAAELLAPRLEGGDRLSVDTCLHLAIRKRNEPEVLLAFAAAAGAFQAAQPGRHACEGGAD